MTIQEERVLPPLSRRVMDEAHRMLVYLCEHAQRERELLEGHPKVRPEPPVSVPDARQRLRELLSLGSHVADSFVVWEARAALLTRCPPRPGSASDS